MYSPPHASGPHSHFWRADRVVVGLGRVDLDRADGLGTVHQHRHTRRLAQLAPGKDLPVEPRDGRQRDQARARRDLGADEVEEFGRGPFAHLCDAEVGARAEQRAGEPEMLHVGRHDLVAGAEVQADDHDLDALGRRARQRDPVGRHADLHGRPAPEPGRDARATPRSTRPPLRPFSPSQARKVAIASSVSRASGPTEPEFRYACCSSTGKRARCSAQFMSAPPPPAHDPTRRRHRTHDRPPARSARARRPRRARGRGRSRGRAG